ncbi:hypothetical protein J4437_07665 [Candidatus Woesearchaeota archaeon]|nr:hypothetical protein [Candidatus Woesearchaeota archaeon]
MVRIYKTHPTPETLARETGPILGFNYDNFFCKHTSSLVRYIFNHIPIEHLWEATGTFTPCDKNNKVLYDENWATTNFAKSEFYLRMLHNSKVVETDDIFKSGEKVITERISLRDDGDLERKIECNPCCGSPDLLLVSACYEIDDKSFDRVLAEFKVITGRYNDVQSILINQMEKQFYDGENNRSHYRKLKKEMDKKLLDAAGEKPSFRKFLIPYVA